MRTIILLIAAALLLAGCGNRIRLNRADGVRGMNAPVVTAEGVRFSVSAPGSTSVTIVGNFNGWSDQATPLKDDGKSVWSVTLPLKKGLKYEYKFVVDGYWIADPDNPDFENNGSGSVNSLIKVQ
jgi:1,4-alpha-glucan branching enzyme